MCVCYLASLESLRVPGPSRHRNVGDWPMGFPSGEAATRCRCHLDGVPTMEGGGQGRARGKGLSLGRGRYMNFVFLYALF